MKYYGVNELREMYLRFFEKKGHLRLKSASLVPENDKSLLLINAGMAPLKAYFTGQEVPPSKRVTSCQKCIRTGDIDNVGKTDRHGTFFEMLGNFSFGDYFKEEAISWSWEFVTQVLKIPKDRLYVTVFMDDDEAAAIWHEQEHVPKSHIFYMGKKDNFWEVGTTGPCGPCSEIYYDRGEEYGCGRRSCTIGCDCDRYIEFWNLVFTEYNKNEDGSYDPLKFPNIDTGMGLERIAAIMQGVPTLFDVDTIKVIRDKVCEFAGIEYGDNKDDDVSVRVITDHMRSIVFMLADKVHPSNEGRGYVLRRLIRRAMRHGRILGIENQFLANLVSIVVGIYGNEYPELEDQQRSIIRALIMEEGNFEKTIKEGLGILGGYIERMIKENKTILDDEKCFKLYDTYGFPFELTREIVEEEGFKVSEEGFYKKMQAQKEQARAARSEYTYMGTKMDVLETIEVDPTLADPSLFRGYVTRELDTSIIAIIDVSEEKGIVYEHVAQLNDIRYIATAETPFFAESGGQVGDIGTITSETGEGLITRVIKDIHGCIIHRVEIVKGYIDRHQNVNLKINQEVRLSVSRNHSATHLLQSALREVIGNHVEQAGSSVNKDRLRFDFTNFEALKKSEIKKVERLVNQKIFEGLEIDTSEMSLFDAQTQGAIALFGEKYGDVVRVVDMEGYSIELCGGTHVTNTSQIGLFKILSESGVSAGVRRIEAITGIIAVEHGQEIENQIEEIAIMTKCQKTEVVKQVKNLVESLDSAKKENQKLKTEINKMIVESRVNEAVDIDDVKVLVTQVDGKSIDEMKEMGDMLKNRLKICIIFLMSIVEEKVNLVAMTTNDLVDKGVNCGTIIKKLAPIVNGKGGGRANIAQGNGRDPTKIKELFTKAIEVIKEFIT
ncbi:alanine--tRNA ligase [Candidatus Epulonipiscium viviparus]|uniref:alanine--tRNA ligase n=1 Tax=Candidatus Epulonipiscium viviparus TaxID=420336 RepID=UPI0027380DA3|nr:alanine--tRNA ligase [Candidatus Epulopiscium viviparus]